MVVSLTNGYKLRQFPPFSARGDRLTGPCVDLMQRMLEKDPKKRIDFAGFFSHPFVDLDHAIGPDSLEKAKALAAEAVSLDVAGTQDRAIRLYAEALDHLKGSLQCKSRSLRSLLN
jgi:hypothetical protein